MPRMVPVLPELLRYTGILCHGVEWGLRWCMPRMVPVLPELLRCTGILRHGVEWGPMLPVLPAAMQLQCNGWNGNQTWEQYVHSEQQPNLKTCFQPYPNFGLYEIGSVRLPSDMQGSTVQDQGRIQGGG